MSDKIKIVILYFLFFIQNISTQFFYLMKIIIFK